MPWPPSSSSTTCSATAPNAVDRRNPRSSGTLLTLTSANPITRHSHPLVLDLLATIDLDTIPQISLGTAALLIFGAIASLCLVRGLLRILWGTLILCIAGLVSFLTWQYSPTLSLEWLGHEARWFSIALPLLTFLLAFFLLRSIGRAVVRPFHSSAEETAGKARRSPIRWALTLLLSLIPTALIWFAGATLLRHAGSVAEIKAYASSLTDQPLSDRAAFLAKLKTSIENAVPSSWFEAIDPLTDQARLNLAKLIAMGDATPPKAIPILEETDLQELLLSDPELRRLAAEGRYSEILRDPRLDQLLENVDLRQVLNSLDL